MSLTRLSSQSLRLQGLAQRRTAVSSLSAVRRWCSTGGEHETKRPGDDSLQSLSPEEDKMVTISYDQDSTGRQTGVAIVSFNMPDKLNALTVELGKVFEKKIRQLRTDPSLRAVVLTGQGKGFSAGGDLDWLADRAKDTVTNNHVTMRMFYDRYLSIRRVPVPVIAAINGAAIGAGMCLSLACDIRLAAQGVKLGFNFVNIGIHPGMGGTHFLPLLTNTQVAARMFLTGDIVTAEKAKELGIVLDVFPKDELMGAALSMARRIAAASPSAVKAVTQTLRAQQDQYCSGLSKSLDWEAENQARNYATGDVLEGVAAIKERRSPNFSTAEAKESVAAA